MVHVEMGQVDKPDGIRVHAQSGQTAHQLAAKGSKTRVEQDVLALHLHQEGADRRRNPRRHVQAFVERIAGIAEKVAGHQFFALVILNPGNLRPICKGNRLRALNRRDRFIRCRSLGGFIRTSVRFFSRFRIAATNHHQSQHNSK